MMSQGNVVSNEALSLFHEWNDNNIRYCHWKSNEHLEAGLMGNTDLDILVDPQDADRASAYMIKHGYKRVLSHEWKSYSGVEEWIGMDGESLVQTHLHIHYRLLTGLKNVKEQYFDWMNLTLNNVKIHDSFDIKVSDPCIECVFLITRVAIKLDFLAAVRFKGFNKSEKQELDYLLKRIDNAELKKVAASMIPEVAVTNFLAVLNNPSNKKAFLAYRKSIINSLSFFRKYTRKKASAIFYSRQFKYKFSKLIKRPIQLKKKVYTGGKLISFIGVDGAGKTTLATFFAKWLSWKIGCKYIYLGTGDGKTSILNKIKKKFVSSKSENSAKNSEIKTHEPTVKKRTFKWQIKKLLVNYVSYSNDKYKYKTIKRIFNLVNDGYIVVTDRFPQMQFDGIYDGMTIEEMGCSGLINSLNERLRRKEAELYKKMCSVNPDIVVKLVIPVEVSLSRKPCTGKALEQVKRKVEITEKLHFGNAKEYVVTPIGDLDTTKEEICNLLWSKL